MNYKSYLFVLLLLTGHNLALAQSLIGERASKNQPWTDLFIRNDGWFGGDGIFAIPLDGKEFVPATEETKTLFIFSDTMVGHFENDTLKPDDFTMLHNSVGLLQGNAPSENQMTYHWAKDDKGEANALFNPSKDINRPGDYYWMGDGFVNVDVDSTLYVFAYDIRDTNTGIYPFEQTGVSLISIPVGSAPPYLDQRQLETPLFIASDANSEQTSYGIAVFVNTVSAGAPNPDGYIYVYGIKGIDKRLMVSRVQPSNFTDFDAWKYWDGTSWSSDITTAQSIAKHVSNEMSVSPLPDGRLILTFQYMTATEELAVQVGRSPVGPFQPMKKIWFTEESNEDLDFFTYNAKAHPHLSANGKLLISYNVNSFDFWNDILSQPDLYRPRFIELDLQ